MLILIIVAIIVVVGISIYNSIKVARIKVEEGASGIDVALAKRYDVITNLVECVKGYAKHEAETLENIIEARSSMTMKEKADCEEKYNNTQTKLLAIAEGYPDLKANENFLQLQRSIVDVEEHLQAARRLYNANVAYYNQRLETFPSNVVANMMKVTKEEYFQAAQEEKENVRIKL
ncbi:LemA family protein [Anaerorhabdus sp.]|uniref:LemA family protein n=1 Tax=Anaerorhabdus sp. TaxID=1872524 RepID=UPI002FC70346